MTELPSIVLRPSYYLLVFFVLIHIGAGVTLYLTILPSIVKIVELLVVLGHLAYTVAWHALHIAPTAISTMVCSVHDRKWILMDRRGNQVSTALMGDSIVTTVLIILNFRALSGTKRSVVLCPDMMTSEAFRRLRAYLRAVQTVP
jgi:hypothetical protein